MLREDLWFRSAEVVYDVSDAGAPISCLRLGPSVLVREGSDGFDWLYIRQLSNGHKTPVSSPLYLSFVMAGVVSGFGRMRSRDDLWIY